MTVMSFGSCLKAVRKEARKKLREVASATGLSMSYISDLEHGRKTSPSVDIIRKLEKFFEVPKNYLWNIAQKEFEANTQLKEIVKKRPVMSLSFMRIAEDLTDEEFQQIIDVANKMKTQKEGQEIDPEKRNSTTE